ncbi:MAG: helix-turn-helix domain-containing protein [Myxococcota bacterium]
MDLHTLGSELLRALRGRRSQVAFSRRLGFRSNVAHAWETGRRYPDAPDVWQAARALGLPVDLNLTRFFGGEPGPGVDPGTADGTAALLRHLRREQPIADLAAAAGRSRHQVSRWLNGVAIPRLPDWLAMVDACTRRVLDWIAIFVDPASLPSAAEAWERLEAARTLLLTAPHAQVVLVATDLDAYRALPAHDDRWLARLLGLEVWEVAGAIDRLVHAGLLERQGPSYAPAVAATVDTRRHPDTGRALKVYWAEAVRRRLDAPGASVSTNVFTVSAADHQRILELYRNTFRQMRAIVAASAPAERVVLIQQALIPLADPRAGE